MYRYHDHHHLRLGEVVLRLGEEPREKMDEWKYGNYHLQQRHSGGALRRRFGGRASSTCTSGVGRLRIDGGGMRGGGSEPGEETPGEYIGDGGE